MRESENKEMTSKVNETIELESKSRIKNLILIGIVCSVFIIILTILDIVIGTILGGDLNAIPEAAIDRFNQLQTNPWLGLYYLDVLNMVTSILMIPVFLSMVMIQRKTNKGILYLSMFVFIIGTTIFINNNAGLAMLGLSKKYMTALASQKDFIIAAGESLLIKGAHGSMGAFIGFVLSMVATMLMSISMIQSNIFGKITGWIGLGGSSLLLVYLILVTFVPSTESIAMALAAPGGILSLAWMILYTLKMIRTLNSME